MAVIYVRVPDELHQALRELAKARRRSVNSEVIVLLEQAVLDARREEAGQ